MYIVTILNKPILFVESFEKAIELIAKDLYISPTINKTFHLENLKIFGVTWFTYGFNTATISVKGIDNGN